MPERHEAASARTYSFKNRLKKNREILFFYYYDIYYSF